MPRSPRSTTISSAALGLALSWLSLLTYFLLVPRWPTLRDSGHLNVALAAVGAVISLRACIHALRTHALQRAAVAALLVSLLPAAFLPFYIYHLSYQLPAASAALQAGDPAADFHLLDQNSQPHTLATLRGRWVLLDFFRGHW